MVRTQIGFVSGCPQIVYRVEWGVGELGHCHHQLVVSFTYLTRRHNRNYTNLYMYYKEQCNNYTELHTELLQNLIAYFSIGT